MAFPRILLPALLFLGLPTQGAVGDEPKTRADRADTVSEHTVLPILLRRCANCHGAQYQEGGLDLRSRESILRGGESGAAMVPGQPEKSLVVQKVLSGAMPPEKSRGQAGIEAMPMAELETLRRWIALGAPAPPVEPDIASTEPDPLVSDEDREFWSFVPPRASPVPPVEAAHRVRNPIDAFLLARLEKRGLTFAPPADRLTMIRRVAFDLTGLPPEPADVRAFLKDRSPDAHERLVERYLASPHHGERWGRFWLDLAGYADSEGKRNADMIRNFAYRYRDYVIRSFNSDKPYSRFLLEQIAGDELESHAGQASPTGAVMANLIATGFLRMAPDGTTANPVNRVEDRLEVIADELDIFSRGILALTMRCARCHGHKYDPIPQRDYYRLVAVFRGAYDPHDWMTPQPFRNQWEKAENRLLPVAPASELEEWKAANQKVDGHIASLRQKLDRAADDAEEKRIEKQIKVAEGSRPLQPMVRALWDRGRPSNTYVLGRGDHLQAGQLVGPGVPSVLTDGKTPFEVKPPWPGAEKTGRRLALARWLIHPDHPLTGRVMVNRVWAHHFGRGIVKSLDNFGRSGTPPSHPELLDWLALEFVGTGFSVKELHRVIMTSSAYRQSSRISEETVGLDPDNELLSHMPLRRLTAEEVRDSILCLGDSLNTSQFGKPDPVEVRADGLVTARPLPGGWRRSVYLRQRRKEMPTILETFDLPQMNPNCTHRFNSTVVSQPLHLLNNGLVHRLARSFAERVFKEAGKEVKAQVEHAHWIALGRPPEEEELRLGVNAILRCREEWAREEVVADDAGNDSRDPSADGSADLLALRDLCHILINSAAFLYID